MQPQHAPSAGWIDALGSTATRLWDAVPDVLQHVLAASLRVAVTVALARALLRLVPALEKLVVSRASKVPASRSLSSDSLASTGRRVATLVKVVGSVARAGIGGFTAVMVLGAVGIDIAPLIAGAGIAGVAVGFGAQSIVKDFFAGFFIVLENHFDVGDTVTINSVTGVVEEMTMRVTVLRDSAGALHYLPNGTITTTTNRTAGWVQSAVEVWSPVAVSAVEVRRVLDEVCAAVNAMREGTVRPLTAVEAEGPTELNGERMTWKLKARARTGEVHGVRALMVAALQQRVPVDERGVFDWAEAVKTTVKPEPAGEVNADGDAGAESSGEG